MAATHAALLALLEAGDWWRKAAGPHGARGEPDLSDMLLSVLGTWQGSRAGRVLPVLHRCREQGARLEVIAVGSASFARRAAAELRCIWWPRGRPSTTRVSVLSSQLHRNLAQHSQWFAALRQMIGELSEDEVLLTAAGTTACRYLQHCGVLWQRPVLSLELPPPRQPFERWLRRLADEPPGKKTVPSTSLFVGRVSPPIGPAGGAVSSPLPIADQLLLQLAHRLHILRLRPRGRLWPAVADWLRDVPPHVPWKLAIGCGLVEEPIAEALIAHGAECWYRAADGLSHMRAEPDVDWPQPVSALAAEMARGGEWLIHCTRRIDGPWPDQTQEDYLDDLLLGRAAADRSPLRTLERILREQCLRASAQAIRCSIGVVCFTALQLQQLAQRHAFQPHRLRWDFCPYGIAIARSWLERQGARPVHYGDAACWQSLDESQRPYFQALGVTRDWRAEQEWRHVGDVRLDNLPAAHAFVFVPSAAEASQLQPLSRWPVITL